MGTGKPEMAQFAPFISELTQKGCKDEVLKLAKEDLELGYPQELVALYAEAGWQMDRCRKFSSIMREDSDGDLLQMLADGGFNPYQMQLLANYYEKGVPVVQLRDVGSKNLTAYDMEQALKLVYQANREAEMGKAGESPEGKDLQEEIASLTEALRQREKELGEQQETNNRQAAENAQLRIKAGDMEKRIKELEQESAGYGSEKRSILEERDRFYQQNQTLLEEKEQLITDLEEIQKEKDGMERRLKEMQERGVSEVVATQKKAEPQIKEEQKDNDDGASYDNDFLVSIKDKNGEKHLVPVERNVRRKPDGLKAFADKILGRGRQSSGLIKQLTGKGLNPAQMKQVRMAVQAGLTGQEVNDLIDSGFSAEEMAQAVEIVVAERAYQ